MTLQCAQAIFILKRAITIDESFSKLCLLSGGPPISLFDMILATEEGSGT
jgi:hypothetical protein